MLCYPDTFLTRTDLAGRVFIADSAELDGIFNDFKIKFFGSVLSVKTDG